MPIEMLRPEDVKVEKVQSDTEIRRLSLEEIEKFVKPYFDKSGNALPNPANSFFMGMVIAGDVVASLCVQVKLHAQPLIVEPGYQSVLPGLVHATEAEILATAGTQWVYLFAPAGKLAQLASSFGMQLEPWVVMSKLVAPEPPEKGVIDLQEVPPPVTAEEMEQYPGENFTQAQLNDLEPEGLPS